MRLSLAAALLLLIIAPAFAKRAPRRFRMEVMPGSLDAPRLAPWQEGWIARRKGAAGDALVAVGADGKAGRTLVELKEGRINAWWAPAYHARIAWVSGGRLFVADIPTDAPGIGFDAGPAPDGEVAWATMGTQVAWVAGGKIHIFDKGVTRPCAPRDGRMFVGSPVFTNDGKEIAIVTAEMPLTGAVGPADAVEALTLETSAWAVVATEKDSGISSLASTPPAPADGGLAPVGAHRRLAWIVQKGGSGIVRFHDADKGTTETIFEHGNAEQVTFAVGTTAVVMLTREAGKNPRAYLVNTYRSGTVRQFAADLISEGTEGELSRPVATLEGYWFLQKAGEGEWKIVVAR